jgi:hypothetical protein
MDLLTVGALSTPEQLLSPSYEALSLLHARITDGGFKFDCDKLLK